VLAADLWPRTLDLGGPAWQARLRGHLLQHLHAQLVLVRMRENATACTVAEYTELRREAFGSLLFFDLIDAADGAIQSADPCGEGCWNDLRALAADVIAWTNDLHSVAKDLVHGEPFNLAALLAGEHRIPVQNALDIARDMIVSAADRFTARKLRHLVHPSLPDPGTTAQATRIGRLEEAMCASADWHAGASRYHLRADSGPPSGAGVVDTTLTPPTLKSRDFETNPYPLYQRLRDTMPIAYDEPTDTWLLSRHTDVRAALTDPRLSNENYTWQITPLLGHTVISMDGKEHAAHRALLTPAFRSRALAVLQDSITEVTTNLVARLRGREQADLVAEFTSPLPIQVMVRALGLPADTPEQVARLKRWCTVGFSYMGNYRQDPGLLAHGLSNRDDFYDYVQPYLEARRARPRNDLISAMLASTVDGRPLSEEYVRGCCGILLAAGSETSHGTLANLIANVLDVPGLLDTVATDPSALDLALAETLRRDPALQLVLRQTRETVDLPSGTVPADATVACLIGSANRDPRRFPDPDTFELHRAEGREDRQYGGAAAHFAFGAGRHFCLGSHLARAEITTGLRLLVAEFPHLRWAPGFRPVPTGFLNRCPDRLEVAL
jgi:cytochrome P450